MCGIAGFIGKSKQPQISYLLLTELFRTLEVRGTDASGIWASEENSDAINYHKAPVNSSEFIAGDYWEILQHKSLDLALLHSRAASKGSEHALNNANNHPFVSDDLKIGLVHNGTLDEFDILRQKYQIESDTDSEILLRIYEYGLDKPIQATHIPEFVCRSLNALRDIWSVITKGSMAVAIGQKHVDSKSLILFRNNARPLWVADVREELGQVFFFSSNEIWYQTLLRNSLLKRSCWGSQKLVEIPPYQVWHMTLDENSPTLSSQNFLKFAVNLSRESVPWEKGEFLSIKRRA